MEFELENSITDEEAERLVQEPVQMDENGEDAVIDDDLFLTRLAGTEVNYKYNSR